MEPVSEMSSKKVVDLVFDLDITNDVELQKDPRKFLEDVLRVRDTTLHFHNAHPYLETCTCDIAIDPPGVKNMCSNMECTKCIILHSDYFGQ